MSPIIVDASLRAQFLAVTGVAEVRDEAGNVIGRFVPERSEAGIDTTGLDDVTDEELDRRERTEPRFSADQVLDRLRGLRR